MSSDLVRAARAEEQRLLRELQATPLFRRLERVRALLTEYGEDSAPTATAHATSSVLRDRSRSSAPRASSLTARVIAATADYLREQQRRAQSMEILQGLQARGIEITGQKPTAVVASILSHCDRFDNVRGEGYGLVEWTPGPESASGNGNDPDHRQDHASGLDSDADLVLNKDRATNGDRPRPDQSNT